MTTSCDGLDQPKWLPTDTFHAENKLRQARAAVTCERDREAEVLLTELRQSTDAKIALRATMQMARLQHRTDKGEEASKALAHVLDRRDPHPGDLTPALTIELARTWSSIGEIDRSIDTYRHLLRTTARPNRIPQSAIAVYAVALAHYRLGELFMGRGDIESAYRHWRKAFEERSEEISPYASYALASRIGGKRLPPERIEWMYMQAIRSNDSELSLRARLELAEFLTQRFQFKSARALLEAVRDLGDASYANLAKDRLIYIEVQRRAALPLRLIHDAVQLPKTSRAHISEHMIGNAEGPRVIIVGAGTGGRYLLDALENCPNRPNVCGFVDDDPTKITPLSHPPLGPIKNLEGIIRREKAEEVLMAIPTASGELRLSVVRACRAADVPLNNIPAMHDLYMGWDKDGHTLANQLRPVKIEETIGDEYVGIDNKAVGWAQGLKAFVVGADGLGAELSRRLAHGAVESLTVLDPNERALQNLMTELEDKHDFHWVIPICADWLDRSFLEREMLTSKPSLVLHAAGLASDVVLERKPSSIAHRDVIGSRAIADAAGRASVPYMLYVSDTRAAQLEGLFGAIKALSEEAVLSMGQRHAQTAYAAVQITPSMGSPGSVLARIASQIDAGRPVAIPSRDATARFVSGARTAELILHVARMMIEQDLKGRLALEAGVVRRIDEVAEEMILLRGHAPYAEIAVDIEAQSGGNAPVELCGESLREHREILRLNREPLTEDLVNTLLTRLAMLPTDVDETRTLEVRTREFALAIPEYFADLPLGVES